MAQILDSRLIIFFIMLIGIFYVRGKNHNAVRILSSEFKEVLLKKFGMMRLLQTLGQISLPICIIFLYKSNAGIFAYAVVFCFTLFFYLFVYQIFINRLRDLAFPNKFIVDYFMDRYLMIVVNALLIGFALRH